MIYNEASAREEFRIHGEEWLMSKLANQFNVVFDVGSNIGEWTRMTREFHPNAEIHTFEIIPDTYKRLLTNIPLANVVANGFGLSDNFGLLKMKYSVDYPPVSTFLDEMRVDNAEVRWGLVMPGDAYVKSKNINYIDYLKIDTEGCEKLVFEGFKETIANQSVGIIQFEYGFANILSRFFLLDVYKLLRPLGYHIGKLTPGRIEFQEYSFHSENFLAYDFVAVHQSKMNLF